MDEIDGLMYCLLNMLSFNEKISGVETEQVSIILGNNFVISFQEDPFRDPFKPLREKLKFAGSKVRQKQCRFSFLFSAGLYSRLLFYCDGKDGG